MSKITFILIVLITIFLSACKKDSTTNNNIRVSNRDKYIGNYNVSENVKILYNSTFNEYNSFTGKIEKFVDVDSVFYPEPDTSYLYFNQATRTKPWSTELSKTTLIYKLIGTDSLEFDVQSSLGRGGKIYGDNDSIVINFWYGSGSIVYDVTQKWIKL